LILDGARTSLPHDLAPDETATVSAWVQIPALTGTLLLQWDVVQENVTWFGERGSPVAEMRTLIAPAQHAIEKAPPPQQPLGNASTPPRAELWRAGVQMWLSYPLLGVGPDNFRHVYGHYLGQADFDDRITANSWYVEMLATTGLMGFMAWLSMIAALVLIVRKQWRTLSSRRERVLAIGLGIALLTFFVHGTVDYFMEFTPTYGLFWLIAGLFVGLLTGTHDVEFAGTVDRV
jgi:hypothetical protein